MYLFIYSCIYAFFKILYIYIHIYIYSDYIWIIIIYIYIYISWFWSFYHFLGCTSNSGMMLDISVLSFFQKSNVPKRAWDILLRCIFDGLWPSLLPRKSKTMSITWPDDILLGQSWMGTLILWSFAINGNIYVHQPRASG